MSETKIKSSHKAQTELPTSRIIPHVRSVINNKRITERSNVYTTGCITAVIRKLLVSAIGMAVTCRREAEENKKKGKKQDDKTKKQDAEAEKRDSKPVMITKQVLMKTICHWPELLQLLCTTIPPDVIVKHRLALHIKNMKEIANQPRDEVRAKRRKAQ